MPALSASSGAVPGAELWMAFPFAALLLSIALGPLVFPGWWHHHYRKLSAGLGLVTAGIYIVFLGNAERLLTAGHEYVSFIALIGSLFVVTGGIHINVQGEATPAKNVLFLAVGCLLANLIGTTGASMLLIRPWIRMSKFRITSFHIVIFIFLIGNVAGCLTPIGDPPLFLGYLRGIPFTWMLQHALPAWITAVGLLLAVFYFVDRKNLRRAPAEIVRRMTAEETWRFDGLHNLVFLAVVLGAVIFNRAMPLLVPEVIMLAAAAGSFATTGRQVHEANAFSLEPAREVAWLFLGIFSTMVPALDYVGSHAGSLGLSTPLQFYFATGFLSAFLDNAPTYLTFLSAQMGLHQLNIESFDDVFKAADVFPREVLAVSLGAVFFGAMTYIGNGPNLLVKAIADRADVHTPGFFAYIFCFALPILLPVLILIGLLFFPPW